MRSRVPSSIRWTRHKKMDELLDDPLAESLYGLFLKVKDSPRHLAFSAENLINEVYYISNECYNDDHPDYHLDDYAREVENDLGWNYAVDLVMPMVNVVIRSQKKIPSKLSAFLVEIEKQYHSSLYWNACQQIAVTKESPNKKRLFVGNNLGELLRNRKDLKNLFGDGPVFIINKVDQLNAILGNNAKIEK